MIRIIHKILTFAFVFLQFGGSIAYAYETDNFTCRHAQLEDVTAQINAETNRRIKNVLEKGALKLPKPPKDVFGSEKKSSKSDNGVKDKTYPETATPKSSKVSAPDIDFNDPKNYTALVGCDRTMLHYALRGALASAWMGNLETWAQNQPFSKCKPEKNIYQTEGVGVMLRTAGINYTLKVGGVNIGADKLSHFMTEGAEYYEEQMNGGDLQEILAIGEKEENGSYGLMTTGVKSYGDLAANYQGYQFWKNTTEGSDPYFKCVNNKWTQVKQFDWAQFVNPLMDESINCSKYISEEFAKGVAKNVEALQKTHNASPHKCPLDIEACRNVSSYIRNEEVQKAIVHPDCLNVNTLSEDEKDVPHDFVR